MTKQLKAIIVEDELASREILAGYIKKYTPDVEVVALVENIEDGIKAVEKHNPDIVFLDIEMPYGNGFDLLEKVKDVNFETVFVTAYANYAIKALNSSASYYLLKPIDIDELEDVVDILRVNSSNTNLRFWMFASFQHRPEVFTSICKDQFMR